MNQPARRLTFPFWLATALVAVVALAPWWRNHAYLRDLYDYGLVIAANGHLNLGARPYVDFTTPIQAGFLWMGWMFECVGSGTYAGLARGGAALILVAAVGLPLLLARRWPWWAAAIVGAAVAVSAASQHTILWHNSLGVVALAFATWATACAPVVRRNTWPWHLVAAAALFLGGVNKVNYQLVTISVCLAWVLRAGVRREAGWGRVLATMAGILLAGMVAPIAAELAWTGASLKVWLANVIELPASARTGILREILTARFWVIPIHNYYGPLLLPQVGLVAIWLAIWAVIGCWPSSTDSRADRFFAPVAALLALGAGAALLATNFEIAPLGLGAWLALIVSLWLGFAPAARPRRFVIGLLVPSLLLGVAAWWSAWQGQRSQFGYSPAPRASYVPAVEAGPAYACLTGLQIPPEVEESLESLARSLPEPDEHGYRKIFYGLGTEWMERCFPTAPEKGKPLWVHWHTSYSAERISRLASRMAADGQYPIALATVARDEWPGEVRAVLDQFYLRDQVGPVLRRWTYFNRDVVDLTNAFETLHRMGGNVVGQNFHFDRHPLHFKEVRGRGLVMGSGYEPGSILVRNPFYRLQGQVVLARTPGVTGPLRVYFKAVRHGAIPEDMKWGTRLELPAGQDSISAPFEFDALGKRVELWVVPDEDSRGRFFAGYRELRLLNSVDANEAVPVLRSHSLPETEATPALANSLLGSIAWRPTQFVVRGGAAGDKGLELAPGGELWLRTPQMSGEIRGQLAATAGLSAKVWVVWYKGGRLEIVQHGQVVEGKPTDFHIWTAEPGGWIGLVLDASKDSSVQVRVNSTTLTP